MTIFHAGTRIEGGRVLADGGRVLERDRRRARRSPQARERAYAAIDRIDWPEGFCRRDIGWRALGAPERRAVAERLESAPASRGAAALARAGSSPSRPRRSMAWARSRPTTARSPRIFAAKGRPRFNPLIVHVAGRGAARRAGALARPRRAAGAALLAGRADLVLPRAPGCPLSPLVSAGGATRRPARPAHPVAQALLEATGLPVAAPSANPAGRISPTTARARRRGLGAAVDVILDGGRCPIGVESTVLDLCGETPRLLRPGGVTRSALEAELGPLAMRAGERRPARCAAPGQLASHYAPARPLRLEARTVAADEALLAFGPAAAGGRARPRSTLARAGISPRQRPICSRCCAALDRPDVRAIAVMPIPACGLGEAIRDRLARAAA